MGLGCTAGAGKTTLMDVLAGRKTGALLLLPAPSQRNYGTHAQEATAAGRHMQQHADACTCMPASQTLAACMQAAWCAATSPWTATPSSRTPLRGEPGFP